MIMKAFDSESSSEKEAAVPQFDYSLIHKPYEPAVSVETQDTLPQIPSAAAVTEDSVSENRSLEVFELEQRERCESTPYKKPEIRCQPSMARMVRGNRFREEVRTLVGELVNELMDKKLAYLERN